MYSDLFNVLRTDGPDKLYSRLLNYLKQSQKHLSLLLKLREGRSSAE